MPASLASKTISGYIELASPQILDDKWSELNFDLASGQNVLQDMITLESGGGYVYRDAKLVGSATHNRFLYWRTVNDLLELVETSTSHILEGNQVRITFPNSPVLNKISVMEFSDSVVIMVATFTSVHRFDLPHPKIINKSILSELTSDMLFNPANYYTLNNSNSLNSQQPICATSWYDKNTVRCALSFPDSSILITQFSRNTHQITTYEIKQAGIIGRLLSRMPSILAKGPNECDNAVFIAASYHNPQMSDVLLIALCRDWKVRVFSTSTRECVYSYNVISQNNLSQSFSMNTNPTAEPPMMKMYGSHIVIYHTENRAEFLLLLYSYKDGIHDIREVASFQSPNWVKLVDFSMTNKKIWALANVRETESVLCYLNLSSILEGTTDRAPDFEEVWDFVKYVDDIEIPSIKNYVAEIFWRNHFSVATVSKAIIGVTGPFALREVNMTSLEELAYTRIVDENQEEAWERFYNYCLQNHYAANKNIGLVTANDESVVCVVKRSNPSFICPLLMSVDMFLQGGPYRGIEVSNNYRNVSRALDYISTELLNDEQANIFEQKLFEDPANISDTIVDIVESLTHDNDLTKLNLNQKNLIAPGIDFIYEQLDLTTKSNNFTRKVLQETQTNIRSDHNSLKSNSGIIITFELFKRFVRARMILARDLLIYVHLIQKISDTHGEELWTSLKVRKIMDTLRSYAILLWIAEIPVKARSQVNAEVINFISSKFSFFKEASQTKDKSPHSSLDFVLHQNLLMNFLVNGGVTFTSLMDGLSRQPQTLSNSFYVTQAVLNLCCLLWPKSDYLCFEEFLFTNQLDEHLDKYLNLTEDWLDSCEYDRHFLRASNCLNQKRAAQAVDIFSRLWVKMNYVNLIGRFIDLDTERQDSSGEEVLSITPSLIYRYHDKLTQLFQIQNNYHSLIVIIHQCISLIDENGDIEQQHWVNCLRAKLFMCYLELEDSDEAYNTMVLTSDSSLRTNCLRKFIVNHCENEHWASLLSYPFVDIKNDFIDILNQKAESSDLSKLVKNNHYATSYYDLLFAFYVSHEEFVRAADVMYNYAQRLAYEVPGLVSIRKQADCLLTALNSLRCVDDKEVYIKSCTLCPKEDGRSSVLKRGYDCESDASMKINDEELSPTNRDITKVYCKDIKMKYELTVARLKLLDKDQTANAIALSPLKPEETISQLVASSMFPTAIDMALLFRLPMDSILEGLTGKYVSVMRLSAVDITLHSDLERDLSDIFTDSYSIIDTYNCIANSTSTFVEKLWRLIDYYLKTYDGVGHRYSSDTFRGTFGGTTVLMKVVADKLLSSGCDIPASLKQMYMSRNTAELLKLLIKYDRLTYAADLAVEMIDRILEPSNLLAFTSQLTNEMPPVYIPTHLILLLISYLSEDATNHRHCKTSEVLSEKLNKFRRSLESS